MTSGGLCQTRHSPWCLCVLDAFFALRAASALPPGTGCPCLHAYLCVTGCAATLIDRLLGVWCAHLIGYPPLPLCVLAWPCVWSWYVYITTSECVEVTEPMQASMSCSSFSPVSILFWAAVSLLPTFPPQSDLSLKAGLGRGQAAPSQHLEPSLHFLFASFLAAFSILPSGLALCLFSSTDGSLREKRMGWGPGQGPGSSQHSARAALCKAVRRE